MILHKIKGDGNCQMSACSFLLFGSTEYAARLREISCTYIRSGQPSRWSVVDVEVDKQNAAWLGEHHIYALSEIFTAPFSTLWKNSSTHSTRCRSEVTLRVARLNNPPFYLNLLFGENHYD